MNGSDQAAGSLIPIRTIGREQIFSKRICVRTGSRK